MNKAKDIEQVRVVGDSNHPSSVGVLRQEPSRRKLLLSRGPVDDIADAV